MVWHPLAPCRRLPANKAYYAKFIIGNTCRELPDDQKYTKVCLNGREREYRYDYHIYLDVVEGDPRIIAWVEVDMGPSFLSKRQYVQNRPKKIPIVQQEDEEDGILHNNNTDQEKFLWRCFESRQRCWGWPGTVRFRIVGISSKDLKVKHDGSEVIEGFFCDQPGAEPSPLKPMPLPQTVGFRVEAMPLPTDRFEDSLTEMPANNQESILVTPLLQGEKGLDSIQNRMTNMQTTQHVSAKVIITVEIDHSLEAARKVALNLSNTKRLWMKCYG